MQKLLGYEVLNTKKFSGRCVESDGNDEYSIHYDSQLTIVFGILLQVKLV